MNDMAVLNAETLGIPSVPIFFELGGNGNLAYYGSNVWVLNMGQIPQGAIGQSTSLAVANASPTADTLSGAFSTWGADFHYAGTNPFSGVAGGSLHGGVTVTAESRVPGWHVGALTMSAADSGGAALAPQTLYVLDYVVPHVI